MLPQVILVVRTPFKSKGAVGTQESTHSSVDTLVDLGLDRDGETSHLYNEGKINTMTWFLIAHLEQR